MERSYGNQLLQIPATLHLIETMNLRDRLKLHDMVQVCRHCFDTHYNKINISLSTSKKDNVSSTKRKNKTTLNFKKKEKVPKESTAENYHHVEVKTNHDGVVSENTTAEASSVVSFDSNYQHDLLDDLESEMEKITIDYVGHLSTEDEEENQIDDQKGTEVA